MAQGPTVTALTISLQLLELSTILAKPDEVDDSKTPIRSDQPLPLANDQQSGCHNQVVDPRVSNADEKSSIPALSSRGRVPKKVQRNSAYFASLRVSTKLEYYKQILISTWTNRMLNRQS